MPNNRKNPKSRILSIEKPMLDSRKNLLSKIHKWRICPLKRVNPKLLMNLCKQVPSRLKKQRKLFLSFQRLGQIDDPYAIHQERYSLMTVTRQIRTRKIFSRKLPATLKKETKTHPYSWMTSRS